MKIIVDSIWWGQLPAGGAGRLPPGCRELGANILLTGDESRIREAAAGAGISLDGIEIANAPTVIPVEADPTSIMKEYADCSMAVGLRLLAEGQGDAFVSAGSTGALVVGSTLMVKPGARGQAGGHRYAGAQCRRWLSAGGRWR